jgi:hypothetical protein
LDEKTARQNPRILGFIWPEGISIFLVGTISSVFALKKLLSGRKENKPACFWP